jgi:phosphoenolpyruvate synthase/pyruvate phosphate dikinase
MTICKLQGKIMKQPFTPLHEVEISHGRKAQGLKSLIQQGLNVPNGIALNTEQATALLTRDAVAIDALEQWLGQCSGPLAVRSSAANEDGELQSFAGMYATRLDVPEDIASVL